MRARVEDSARQAYTNFFFKFGPMGLPDNIMECTPRTRVLFIFFV